MGRYLLARARGGGRAAGISPRARPFVGLFLIAVLVWGIDLATGRLTREAEALPFEAVSAVRLVTALAILRYPLAGFVLTLEVDKWDWFWLGMGSRSAADQVLYQQWDKGLDLAGFALAAVVVWRWRDERARALALGAFGVRVTGVAAFLATGQRWLLIAFPNAFESMFLIYVLFRTLTGHERMLEGLRSSALVALALVLPKVVQEYFLHALGKRPWHLVQLTAWPLVDVWFWAAMLYALPVIALTVLIVTSDRRGPDNAAPAR